MIPAGRVEDRISSATWRKSSYSGGDNECIEVADGAADIVPVRDSKDAGGPVLAFTPPAWRSFVRAVRAGEFPVP